MFFRSWNLLLLLQANVYPLSMPQCLFLKYYLHFYLQFSEISIYLPPILMMHFFFSKIKKKKNYILTLLFSVSKIAQFTIPIKWYFESHRYNCMLQSDFQIFFIYYAHFLLLIILCKLITISGLFLVFNITQAINTLLRTSVNLSISVHNTIVPMPLIWVPKWFFRGRKYRAENAQNITRKTPN